MGEPRISLRPATDADYDFLWALHSATMRRYVEQTWGWDDEWQATTFEQRFDPEMREVVERDGVAVGSLSVKRRPGAIELLSIQIEPAHQNARIGTRVLRDLLDEADRRGLLVECQVLKVNPVRRLYERLGFQIEGETETHYQMRRFPNRAA